MDKIKTTFVCLLVLFFALIGLTFWRIKNKEEFQQKVVLAREMHKALEHLMVDLREGRENIVQNVPADGQWHRAKSLLIADNMADLRMRRIKETPDILEVQIQVHKNVSLESNLKIRISQ